MALQAAGRGCRRPGGSRGLGARLAQPALPLQPLDVLLHVLSRLGRGRRFRAQAPRHQPVAGSARPRGQGPPPAPGGPVPGPDGGLGHNGGDRAHPSEHPRGLGLVQNGQGHPQHLGPAVITSHPGIVAQAARACQAPGLPPPRGCRRPAGAGRRRCSGPAASALAPRRSPAQPGSPGRAAGPCHLLLPRAEVPRTADSSSNPGDPIHYESNLVTLVRRFRHLEK